METLASARRSTGRKAAALGASLTQAFPAGLRPNMALQRTRRPRIRSGRSLYSLGSPRNARPSGRNVPYREALGPTAV